MEPHSRFHGCSRHHGGFPACHAGQSSPRFRVAENVAVFAVLVAASCTAACAVSGSNGTDTQDTGRDGGTNIPNTGTNDGSSTQNVSTDDNGIQDLGPQDLTTCGNGELDSGEACDDGNIQNGDGCNRLCRIEADWDCPVAGEPCVYGAICGDGLLSSVEGCDDGNADGGDGCTADCTVEPGWQCRMAGRACVPLCGDGVVTPPENCDDGNTESGDGCTSICLTEPGWSCESGTCIQSVCGNGAVEVGETCDAGERNGLFLGDATGCSKTCTPEPNCRDTQGDNMACATVCGDGNVDADEDCDDGNNFNDDGCAENCVTEAGFSCDRQINPDSQTCSSGSGDCLVLPVVFRDFDGQHLPTGHPDFFYMGASVNGQVTTCVTNASGTMATLDSSCASTDATENCTNLLADRLGPDGKPRLNPSSDYMCHCRFTDWDRTGVIQMGMPGVEQCWVTGDGSERLRIDTMVKTIQSAESFSQWYNPSDYSTEIVSTLELERLGSTNQFQFSSNDGATLYTDLHNIFLGNADSLTSGFFPLEDSTHPKMCNLWPYWRVGDGPCIAGDGQNIPTQWDPRGSYDPNTPEGDGGPIPGSGTTTTQVIGLERNFYFTSEARYMFRYVGGEILEFDGDDDFWVFFNGHLTLDFGSPHERLRATVTLASSGAEWTVQGFDVTTNTWTQIDNGIHTDLGMEVGNTYELAFFHADRHPRESNYQLTLSSFETTRSACMPSCGDGIRVGAEECDDGDANADDVYGGCTTECRYGPFCGDGEINGPEQCDLGRDNASLYGEGAECTPGCTTPHFCGDGFIDTAFGEQCDPGEEKSEVCVDCRIIVL